MNSKSVYLVLAIVVICAVVTFYKAGTNNKLAFKGIIIRPKNDNQDAVNKTKKILFWNRWWIDDYGFGVGREPFLKHCRVNACETLNNKSLVSGVDAIIFWGQRYSAKISPRTNDQQVVLHLEKEPAVFSYGKIFPNVNATISYRRDSTFHWKYGYYSRRTAKDGQYVPLNDTQVLQKSKLVTWMISRCNRTFNIRQTYVRQLQKYVDVDIYGKCGNQNDSCRADCLEKLEAKYKFYLAFENCYCHDYVTEKAFRTLRYNIVPVVMGGADYKEFLPPNSFIDARDYKSPKELANYLKLLDRNPDMYREYLAWKHKYVVHQVTDLIDVFCSLCEKLWNPGNLFKKNIDTTRWWSNNTCVMNRTKLMDIYHIKDDTV